MDSKGLTLDIGNYWDTTLGINITTGTYKNNNINCGIKVRNTVDLVVNTDIYNVEVKINKKSAKYAYNKRSGYTEGINQEDYKNQIRQAYLNNSFTNNNKIRDVDNDEYNIYLRPEEITNGEIPNGYYNDSIYTVCTPNKLEGDDKLKIYVTYKIAIKNQSQTEVKVMEIADYSDLKYEYIESYIGNSDGTRQKAVTRNNTSKYGINSQYTSSAYSTNYLIPEETTLKENEELYIYIKFQLIENEQILKNELLTGNAINTMHLAEINGYKTEQGLIDIDSNPGNANENNVTKLLQGRGEKSIYEDDISLSPKMRFKSTTVGSDNITNKIAGSRTIEGVVFEDATKKSKEEVYIADTREGDGEIKNAKPSSQTQDSTKDKLIKGVIVQLIENETDKVLAQARTDEGGWYGFIGFTPGNYKIKYEYGKDDKTAMISTPPEGVEKGENPTSYNGNEYQATKYTTKSGNLWWYTINDSKSDAQDNNTRADEVIDYTKTITNYKAEVLNSYKNPQPDHIDANKTRELANKLEENTYRYAYTEPMSIEVEYATTNISGTLSKEEYENKIAGIDFGIVQRPKTKLVLEQNVENVKLTLADGTELINKKEGKTEHLTMPEGGKNKFSITLDDELKNGAELEVTYKIAITNKSEQETGKTRAKNIINYVSNNLSYNEQDNKNERGEALWEVVRKDEVQTDTEGTYINNKAVDLSTQAIILKATENNPITKELEIEEEQEATITLRKVLSTENDNDDFGNIAEIIEIYNEKGIYDTSNIPGNQNLEQTAQEYDTVVRRDDTIMPPTGNKHIYYTIGIFSVTILGVGTFLIKKYVL